MPALRFYLLKQECLTEAGTLDNVFDRIAGSEFLIIACEAAPAPFVER